MSYSLDPETVARLMDAAMRLERSRGKAEERINKATMIFTDPPYNVKIDGHVGGKGKIKQAEFAMASGEMSQDEFTTFLRKAFENLTRFAKDGSINFMTCSTASHSPYYHRFHVVFATKYRYKVLRGEMRAHS